MLHTGDFKMDQFPLDGRITDLRAFARLGEEGVDLFLVDSTNAEVPGFTTSERELGPGDRDGLPGPRPRRIIVSSFASHVHRIQQVLDAAATHGRKVAFVGRSMVRNMGIAQPTSATSTSRRGSSSTSSSSSGCPANQIDPDLHRVAGRAAGRPVPDGQRATTPSASREGDTVLLASSLIPGNENAIYRVINELTRWGANVVHKGNAKVHVSGHASAGELAYCYNIVQPSNVLPVHGEWRHLRANADLAIRTGVDPKRVLIAAGRRRHRPRRRPGEDHRHRARGARVRRRHDRRRGDRGVTCTCRRTLAEEGVVTVVCIVDADTGKLAEEPDYLVHGFEHESGDFTKATPAIQKALTTATKEGIEDVEQVEELVRQAMSNWVHRQARRSPLIIPVIVDA